MRREIGIASVLHAERMSAKSHKEHTAGCVNLYLVKESVYRFIWSYRCNLNMTCVFKILGNLRLFISNESGSIFGA